MAVELWNDQTGNLISEFDTETEALMEIRAVILQDGHDAVIDWALDRFDDGPMIRGQQLVERALAAAAA